MKTVGIIGGLGPETTSEFYLKVVFGTKQLGAKARPGVLISSVPLPLEIEEDLIMRNVGSERYIPYLVAEAIRLEKADANFIVMPCNSLHVYINEIRNSVNVPVLSIIEETVKYIKEQKYGKIGIVSTSATVKNMLYENAFKEAGIAYATPNDLQQEKMGKIILNLINSQFSNRDREEIISIIDGMQDSDIDAVALACTDLQLLLPTHAKLPIFDTMEILAQATIKNILN